MSSVRLGWTPEATGPIRMTRMVADRIWRIPGSRNNMYLIGDDDGSLCLVDTGYPGDWRRLTAVLGTIGRLPGDVSAVLLTHAHPDHVGNAERLRVDHQTPVHVHVNEAPLARGERRERIATSYMFLRLWWPKMASFVLNAVSNGATKVAPVGSVTTFDDRQQLHVPGRPTPVFTPGHTSGHCAFHLPERGVLISGDALVTRDALTRAVGPRLLDRAFNHRQTEAVKSLERLRDLDADVVLPGHGDPFHGSPAQAVDQALANS